MKFDVDVVVVGAGPAGAIAALNLAPLWRTLLIDRRAEPQPRVGESLVSAAGPLLRDMGLLAEFEAFAPREYHGNESVWTSETPEYRDFISDPHGPGWHVDRSAFEKWLIDVAARRGAAFMNRTRLASAVEVPGGWELRLSRYEAGAASSSAVLNSVVTSRVVTSRVVIDAGGRASPFARIAGTTRRRDDPLICGWIVGEDSSPGGVSTIEACQDGWWYSAPLPGDQRIVSFHTDVGLPAADVARSPEQLLELARSLPLLSTRLAGFCPTADLPRGCVAAGSGALDHCAGTRWLAVGDAALSFDPIVSRGIFNAIYTGLGGAESVDRCLRNNAPFDDYRAAIAAIELAYRQQFRRVYAAQPRWPDSLFWRRRREV